MVHTHYSLYTKILTTAINHSHSNIHMNSLQQFITDRGTYKGTHYSNSSRTVLHTKILTSTIHHIQGNIHRNSLSNSSLAGVHTKVPSTKILTT